jgi:hypothetical protein
MVKLYQGDTSFVLPAFISLWTGRRASHLHFICASAIALATRGRTGRRLKKAPAELTDSRRLKKYR